MCVRFVNSGNSTSIPVDYIETCFTVPTGTWMLVGHMTYEVKACSSIQNRRQWSDEGMHMAIVNVKETKKQCDS